MCSSFRCFLAVGGGVPKPSLTRTYRTASQTQLVFSFPQRRVTLTSSHAHTRRDVSECRVRGLSLSCSPAEQDSACRDVCHHNTWSPCSAQGLSPFPAPSTAPTPAVPAAPEQPLEVQQGHTSRFPPSQPCLLCSSGSDTLLSLLVLKRRSEVQGGL